MYRVLLWLLVVCCSLGFAVEKPIVVLTTAYNVRQWTLKNVNSILKQDYGNYRVIYVDDASSDGTADFVETIVQKARKRVSFHLVRNHQRKGALYNIYSAIHSYCGGDEIVVSLDGDDWFSHDRVLRQINEAYNGEKEVWLTHGSMQEFPSNGIGWSIPIPSEIVDRHAFRTFRCPSHLRTFYAWLFKKIRLEDLLYQGEFFSMTWDQAIMFPMIEMAAERHAFISDCLYIYNHTNPLNDNKVNAQLQNDLEKYIRAMPPYERLKGK